MIEDNEDDGVGAIAIPAERASEDKLGSLHGVVAEFLTLKIATGRATGPEIGAAIAFLKNNSITASPAVNKAAGDLKAALANRKKTGGITAAGMREASAAFEHIMPGMFPQ